MKNFEMLAAVRAGVLELKSNGLSSQISWRAFQLRKALSKALGKYQDTVKSLLEEAGIDEAFEKSFMELKQKENLSKEEADVLSKKEEAFKKYEELVNLLINEKIDLSEIKPMPFEDWRKLVDLNTDKDGKSPLGYVIFYSQEQPVSKVDIEASLENEVWYAPKD